MKRQLQQQRDGNLFDLSASSPEDIARCIVEEVTRLGKFTKASQISAALTKAIAAAKKRGSTSKAG